MSKNERVEPGNQQRGHYPWERIPHWEELIPPRDNIMLEGFTLFTVLSRSWPPYSSTGGLNEQFTVKGVHGHTFPNHHGKRAFSLNVNAAAVILGKLFPCRFNLAGKGTFPVGRRLSRI